MSLKEIARIAGTSVSTVSRVLNQPDYKCKNPELESRIWAAAQEIRYTPNTAAQTLKSGISLARTEEKTMTFDIFLTRFPSLSQDLFFSELFESLKKELLERYQISQNTFTDAPEEDQDFLKLFSFICILSFDVYVKKMIIEQMIDKLREDSPDNKHKR